MDADGSNQRQVTSLGAASFAPFFHPSGEKIVFSSNHGSEGGGSSSSTWSTSTAPGSRRSPTPPASTDSPCGRRTARPSCSAPTTPTRSRARPTSSSPGGWSDQENPRRRVRGGTPSPLADRSQQRLPAARDDSSVHPSPCDHCGAGRLPEQDWLVHTRSCRVRGFPRRQRAPSWSRGVLHPRGKTMDTRIRLATVVRLAEVVIALTLAVAPLATARDGGGETTAVAWSLPLVFGENVGERPARVVQAHLGIEGSALIAHDDQHPCSRLSGEDEGVGLGRVHDAPRPGLCRRDCAHVDSEISSRAQDANNECYQHLETCHRAVPGAAESRARLWVNGAFCNDTYCTAQGAPQQAPSRLAARWSTQVPRAGLTEWCRTTPRCRRSRTRPRRAACTARPRHR